MSLETEKEESGLDLRGEKSGKCDDCRVLLTVPW